LLSGPKDRLFGSAAKTLGIKKSTIVVIAQKRELEVATGLNAFSWIRAITNHIPQAADFLNALRLDVLENRG
jgi:hypothetical protein